MNNKKNLESKMRYPFERSVILKNNLVEECTKYPFYASSAGLDRVFEKPKGSGSFHTVNTAIRRSKSGRYISDVLDAMRTHPEYKDRFKDNVRGYEIADHLIADYHLLVVETLTRKLKKDNITPLKIIVSTQGINMDNETFGTISVKGEYTFIKSTDAKTGYNY